MTVQYINRAVRLLAMNDMKQRQAGSEEHDRRNGIFNPSCMGEDQYYGA